VKRLVVVLFVLLTGCGYSAKPLLKSGVRTVYVPVFDNKTFRREIEFQLTEAVKNEILYKTDLKIVPKEKADSILEGEIVDFRERVLTEDSHDNAEEVRVFVYVNVRWRDLRTGRTLMSQERITAPTEFYIPKGETVRTATAESFRDLAELIVNLMEEEW